MSGKVYLVGSGTGDPELLTLKAYKLLRIADVVIYDNLVSQDVLALVNEKAEKIFVGKVSGKHLYPQEKINALLVEKAKKNNVVVRLKGGDPLIFGRVGDEMAALDEAGIDYEVVPGVTAASAAASKVKLPLTHREFTSMVTFVSGHRKNNMPLDISYKNLLNLGGTIVVYMGVGTMEEMVEGFLKAGFSGDTPVLVAQAVDRSEEIFIKTTLANLPKIKKERNLKPPVVWILGKVVKLAKLDG